VKIKTERAGTRTGVKSPNNSTGASLRLGKCPTWVSLLANLAFMEILPKTLQHSNVGECLFFPIFFSVVEEAQRGPLIQLSSGDTSHGANGEL